MSDDITTAEAQRLLAERRAEMQRTGRVSTKPGKVGRALRDVEARARRLAERAAEDGPPPPKPESSPCPLCKGAGTVAIARDYRRGHEPRPGEAPWYAQMTRACWVCDNAEGRAIQRARLREAHPLDERLLSMAREVFRADWLADIPGVPVGEKQRVTEMLSEACRMAARWSQSFPAGVLALDGPFGTGKTLLLAKVYARAWRSGRSVIYKTGPEFEREMLSFEASDSESERALILSDMAAVDVLIVDEADIMKPGGLGSRRAHRPHVRA